MTLFANRLLWPAGLVFCFPLIMLLVERSRTPVARGLLLLAPFFLPLEVLYDQRFGVWLVMVALCLVRDRRMRVEESQEELLKAA